MKRMQVSAGFLVIVLAFSLPILSCGGGGGGGEGGGGASGVSGTINTTDYTIAAGETVSVTGNLIINATGLVRINGNLSSTGDLGQNITINAERDVTISGSIVAGKGATGGGGGGGITIASNSGNIVLGSGASIRAGDGADGQATSTASGGAGGSVTFNAPNGSITIPDAAGVIVFGNGGNGADITTTVAADTSFRIRQDTGGFNNHGGDSGVLAFNAKTLIGIDYDTITVTENFPPGSPIYRVGDVIKLMKTTKPFSGGRGGNGGSVELNASSSPALDGAQPVVMADDLRVVGGNGGTGYGSGGNGGSVRAMGKDGTGEGMDGQTVYAQGGNGGNCSYSHGMQANFSPGYGGSAFARGGNGAKGADPNGRGGAGGFAKATGGDSGSGIDSITGQFSYFVYGGDAEAYGGNGGNGGNGCGPLWADSGGDAGNGGAAIADAGSGRVSKAHAFGGNGVLSGGNLGYGGLHHTIRGTGNSASGNRGSNGTICVKVPTLAQLPGIYTLTGTKSSDTCGGRPTTIYNPGVTVTVSGNNPIFNSNYPVEGPYLPTTGAFSGVGMQNGVTREQIIGFFSITGSSLQFLGSLVFHETVPTNCQVTYNVKYEKPFP